MTRASRSRHPSPLGRRARRSRLAPSLRAYGLGMTSDVLTVILAAGLVTPLLLGIAAQRRRSRPVPVRVRASERQPRPVNRSIER